MIPAKMGPTAWSHGSVDAKLLAQPSWYLDFRAWKCRSEAHLSRILPLCLVVAGADYWCDRTARPRRRTGTTRFASLSIKMARLADDRFCSVAKPGYGGDRNARMGERPVLSGRVSR
jgi:hypothetical protein